MRSAAPFQSTWAIDTYHSLHLQGLVHILLWYYISVAALSRGSCVWDQKKLMGLCLVWTMFWKPTKVLWDRLQIPTSVYANKQVDKLTSKPTSSKWHPMFTETTANFVVFCNNRFLSIERWLKETHTNASAGSFPGFPAIYVVSEWLGTWPVQIIMS